MALLEIRQKKHHEMSSRFAALRSTLNPGCRSVRKEERRRIGDKASPKRPTKFSKRPKKVRAVQTLDFAYTHERNHMMSRCGIYFAFLLKKPFLILWTLRDSRD